MPPVGGGPVEPSIRHVWVRSPGGHGPPQPGVVVCWQHAPVHNAGTSDWVALVAVNPFGTALLVCWLSVDRLIPIRDPTPADARL